MSNEHPPVDFAAEEEALYELCNRAAVAVYKFFELFTVKLPDTNDPSAMASVNFGKTIEDDEVDRVVAKQVRAYVKEMKRTIRASPKDYKAEEGRRKIFWFLTMLFQHGVFAANQQSKIMTYAQFVFHESKEEE
jgi:hypothetical protein